MKLIGKGSDVSNEHFDIRVPTLPFTEPLSTFLLQRRIRMFASTGARRCSALYCEREKSALVSPATFTGFVCTFIPSCHTATVY